MAELRRPRPGDRSARIEGCEKLFDDGCATIRRGHADLSKQKLARVFFGPLPFVLWLAIGGILFAPVWFFVDPAWIKIAAIQTQSSWAMAAGGAAAIVSLVFVLILLGVTRSKSGAIYLEIQQAYAELKTAQYAGPIARRSPPAATGIRETLRGRSSLSATGARKRRDEGRATAERCGHS